MQLSKHFTLAELTRSDVAVRKEIANVPSPEQVENLRALCENVLEPLRRHVDKPLRVNSGFRSAALNKEIGGSKTSQHMHGEAADIEVDGFDNRELAQLVLDLNLPFDQLLLEHYTDGMPNSGWVHVSHRRNDPQRREVLRVVFKGGKTTYLPGL